MKVIKIDREYSFIESTIEILDILPIGIYDIIEEKHGLSLSKRIYDKFECIDKVYGKIPSILNKLSKDIQKSDKLGILLIGEKGTGKTLLTKKICNASNLPIIIVSSLHKDYDLNKFLLEIPGKFILFIDEFDKTFSTNNKEADNPQDKILSLLDGNFTNKMITILTANDSNKIHDCLLNRTKRIKYAIEFNKLTKDDILEVVTDLNLKEDIKSKLLNLHKIVGNLNYDVLLEIINELIEYPEYSLHDILFFMNIKITNAKYNIEAYSFINNEKSLLYSFIRSLNPHLYLDIDIYCYIKTLDKTVNLDKVFSNTEYTVEYDGDKILVKTKEEITAEGENLGKLLFVFSPYLEPKLLTV